MRILYPILFLLLTGCGAIKGMLKPMVCDCEVDAAKACANPAKETTVAEAPIVTTNPQPTDPQAPTAEPQPTQTYPELIAAKATDVTVKAKVDVSENKRESWRKTMGATSFDKRGVLLEGDFASSKGGKEQVLIQPSGEMIVRNGRWKNKLPMSDLADVGDLPDLKWNVEAVQLVDDKALEIMVLAKEKTDAFKIVYHVRVFKVIGERIGLIYTNRLAERSAEGLVVQKKIEIIDTNGQTAIRAIPFDKAGLLNPAGMKLFLWNKWEGMFREPRKAPTAPRR